MTDNYIYTYDIGNIKFMDFLNEYLFEFFPNELYSFHINSTNTYIQIIFITELTNNELNILNNAMETYDPPQNKYNISKTVNMMLSKTNVSTTTYSLIGTEYSQYNENESIGYIDIISMVNGAGSYKLRLYDTINNTLICQTNSLNNDVLQLIRINDINNLPTNNTILELQCQVSDTDTTCVIKSMQIVYYSN